MSDLQRLVSALDKGKSVLLHAFGGSGKTTLLQQLINESATLLPGKVIEATALTGCAAIALCDGLHDYRATTLNRWAGIGLGKREVSALVHYIRNGDALKRWKSVDILIVDEVSMLGDKLFTKLEAIARQLRDCDKPFGGIQLLFSGDFFQLAPVHEEMVFTTPLWEQMQLEYVPLFANKRFTSHDWFALLMRARVGNLTEEDITLLQSRTVKPKRRGDILPTILYSRKLDVGLYNMQRLQELEGKAQLYEAQDFKIGAKKLVSLPTDPSRDALWSKLVPHQLPLKVGAQVMLKSNLDLDQGLVNGSRGVVKELLPDGVVVAFLKGTRKIMAKNWEAVSGGVVYVRKQLPLTLAWAQSIHTSQGATLDWVLIDLGDAVFAPGQGYVALSRARDINNVYLIKFQQDKVCASEQVMRYVDELECGRVRKAWTSLYDTVVQELNAKHTADTERQSGV